MTTERISLIKIYGLLKEQNATLQDLKADFQAFKKDIGYNGCEGRLGRAEKRIETLEKLVSKITGVYLGVAGIVSTVVAVAIEFISRFWR